jgi:molecular chaperone DnaK (HSP70)
VEHAFDDLRVRQWIEAKLRAQEVLEATRKGLAECAGELDAAHTGAIEKALQSVEEVLASEYPAGAGGDPRRLKEAVGALDEATKPLAEILMDRAMEGLLRKRGLIA